jgi:hypothetical protein
MTKTQQLARIDKAFNALPNLQDGFRDVSERIFDLCLASEKDHRRGHGTYNCSARIAARYFTVKYLLDGWNDPDRYTVDHITSIRNEVLYAQVYAKNFHKELTQWAESYSAAFDAVDYYDIIDCYRTRMEYRTRRES